jgi:hypothetical protein
MDHLTPTADVEVNSTGARTTPTTNAIGAHVAPANAPPSDAIRPDDAIDIARTDAMHLTSRSDASHLSACTAETQVSTITEDSMLNPELHLEPGTSSWERTDVGPHLDTNRALAQFRIDCSARGNETQEHAPEKESQFQSTYSNNTDNPCSHKLSAVSNIAAAGPGGGTGSYGHLPVCESPSAEGEAGSRVRPDSPTAHEDVIPISTPTPGSHGKTPVDMDPVRSGDDRSGTIPGHAFPNYDYAPTFNYAPGADHYPQANVPGSSTSMNQPINQPTNQLYQSTIPGSSTSRNQYNTPTAGDFDANISSHNGNQGWFGPGVKGGLPPLDSGHYVGTGKGKGIVGVLTGRVHVAHDAGQAPETFMAQALRGDS